MMHISEVLPNVTILANARIRKATGQKLTDPAGIVDPTTLIRIGSYANTPSGLLVYVQDLRFVEGELRAFFMVAGSRHSELVSNLTPAKRQEW